MRERLSREAPPIGRERFDDAWKQCADPSDRPGGDSRGETAHEGARSAVKQRREKRSERWAKKG